jgi:hypothetical protein
MIWSKEMASKTKIDFANRVDDRLGHIRRFYLDPKAWKALRISPALQWKHVNFGTAAAASIPKQRGVYAFIVSPSCEHTPPMSYLMYIGISGHSGRKTGTLYKRYHAYLQEVKTLKRPKIHYMLTKWSGHVQFHFSTVGVRCDLAKLEAQLNDTFIPPCNDNDFSASIRSEVAAFP